MILLPTAGIIDTALNVFQLLCSIGQRRRAAMISKTVWIAIAYALCAL